METIGQSVYVRIARFRDGSVLIDPLPSSATGRIRLDTATLADARQQLTDYRAACDQAIEHLDEQIDAEAIRAQEDDYLDAHPSARRPTGRTNARMQRALAQAGR